MSQSPLARSSRRSLHAFAHPPSKLSKSSSLPATDDASPSSSPSPSAPNAPNAPITSGTAKFSPHTPTTTSSNPRYRNAGSSTSTPVTPRIHYSPYAMATPPQSLSKSASIPFDMAASAKAARKAEEEARMKSPTPEGEGAVKRKRFIRRKSFWQRTQAFPQKVIDKFLFHAPTSIQDLLPDEHLANPIALGLTLVHYLLVAPLFAAHEDFESVLRTGKGRSVPSKWERWENEGKQDKVGMLGGWVKFILTFLFFALAAGNAVYLFTRFRTYDMQLRSAQDPLRSPHASPVAAPKVKVPKDDDDNNVFAEQSSGQAKKIDAMKVAMGTFRVLLFIVKFTFYSVLSAFGKRQRHSEHVKGLGSENRIQSLRVWDPPEFCLAFFCAYPPTSPLLTHLLTPIHPFLTPLLHLSTTFLLSHLAQSYAQLVKDRMLLSAEVMREYDQRFVYKRVFANRVDRGTSTHESEFVGW
ncbi:hypothetical protein IAT38_001666 [Cryptococcus sp. DSM 104549]